MRPCRLLLLVCALVLARSAVAAGYDPADVTPGAYGRHRLMHRFDFEEARLNNFEEMPIHWFAIGRPADTANPNFARQPLHQQLTSLPGYPPYAQVRFDIPQYVPGNHSLYLGLNGGNAGAFVEVGALPAVPQSDYLITAWVLTDGVRSSRAKLVAYFIDDHGNRIDASIATTKPLDTGGRWRRVAIKLRGDHDAAAWIGIEAHLVQPKPTRPILGEHQVVYDDVRGRAWFDDISVWQVPRLVVMTQSPVGVVRAPQGPKLTMQVRDLMGRSLLADVTVFDHMMRPVASERRPIGDGAPNHWLWAPPVGRFGWYAAELTVREPTGAPGKPDDMTAIARTLTTFVWLPAEPTMARDDARRFSFVAEDIPPSELERVPELLDQADIQSVVLSAWTRADTEGNIADHQARLDRVITGIVSRNREVQLSLYPVPTELAERIDTDPERPLSLFATDRRDLWERYLTPVLMTHGQRVHRWQIGSPDIGDAFYVPQIAELMRRVNRQFHEIAPNPQLVLPWKLYQSRVRSVVDVPVYLLDVPPAVPADAIGAYTDEWTDTPAVDFQLHLREAPAMRVGHDARAEGLARRMVQGWNAGAAGLAISRPWHGPIGRGSALNPDPLLAVFTTVAHRLAGRRLVGELPVAEGVRCLIFDGPAGGMLAAWNQGARPGDAVIDMYLGPKPVVIDVWGNRTPATTSGGRHHVELAQKPLFIEGIDPALALLRASFRVDPPFINSELTPHRRELTLTNPWPKTISGRLRVTEPKSWTIVPREHHFSIAPGQQIRLPMQVQFPASEVAGEKSVVARMNFTADERYEVDLSAVVELGLPGIDFDATLTLDAGANPRTRDAVVTSLITNTGEKTVALYAFAGMRGYPRQERIIAQLHPGQSVVRRFRFPAAEQKLRATPVRVGVRESTGPAVLNKVLSLDNG